MPPELLGAIVGALLTSFLGYALKIRRDAVMQRITNRATKAEKELETLKQYKNTTQANLRASEQIDRFTQPTLLVGPRGVGKTSLLVHWHTPWDYSRIDPNTDRRTAYVPFHEQKDIYRRPHYADPEVQTTVHGIFSLKILDFPGELHRQKDVIQAARDETVLVKSEVDSDSGIVLICLFDASEALTGKVSADTNNYYNGDLFANLQKLVSFQDVAVTRIVVVFNKFDLLESASAETAEDKLLQRCLDTFEPILRLMRRACNNERMCEIATVLDRSATTLHTRNSTVVMGEAARGIVENATSRAVADSVVPPGATTLFENRSKGRSGTTDRIKRGRRGVADTSDTSREQDTR